MKYKRIPKPGETFRWPVPPLHVALVEPEIPPNTGNISRLCAATGSPLHLIGRLGFQITDASLRRAGLDYWDSVNLTLHPDFDVFRRAMSPARMFLFTTKGETSYTDVAYAPGDILVFGCETRGLSDEILQSCPENILTIPMMTEHVRSLNLSSAVCIVLYEALRQMQK